MAKLKLRLVEEEDGGAIAEIYRNNLEAGVFTLDTESLQEGDVRAAIAALREPYPFLVCEMEGCVLGFAYGGRHVVHGTFGRPSAALDFNASLFLSVSPSAGGRGIGRALYDALEQLLRAMGVINLYSGVVAPNPRAQHFHMAMGYMEVGKLYKTGFQGGRWRDYILYQKSLALHDVNPAPICPISALDETKIIESLRHGEQFFRK